MSETVIGPPFEAYKGPEPYIFVSYAHEDAPAVFADLVYLDGQGYRIWYDEGIDPGNEWPDEIARALASCTYFVVFITKTSVQSNNVKNEINFALNRRKQFLAIRYDDAELPPGLELRMGDIQAVMKHRISQEGYRRKLERTLPAILSAGKKEIPPDSNTEPKIVESPRPIVSGAAEIENTKPRQTDSAPKISQSPPPFVTFSPQASGPAQPESPPAPKLSQPASPVIPLTTLVIESAPTQNNAPTTATALTLPRFLKQREIQFALAGVVGILLVILYGLFIGCWIPNQFGCGTTIVASQVPPTATRLIALMPTATLSVVPTNLPVAKPTETKIPSATHTRTLAPSLTHTATPTRAIPTSTTAPTHTQTPTPTLAIPTATSSTVPTATRTPTAASTSTRVATRAANTTASATATRAATTLASAPVLVAPAGNPEFTTGVNLQWSWAQELSVDEMFQVLAWQDGSATRDAVGTTTEKSFLLDFDSPNWKFGRQAGTYFWTVRVIRTDNRQVTSEGSPFQFRIKERQPTLPPEPTSVPQPTDRPEPTAKPTKEPPPTP